MFFCKSYIIINVQYRFYKDLYLMYFIDPKSFDRLNTLKAHGERFI